MADVIYIPPISITKIETKEFKESWGGQNTKFFIHIHSGAASGGASLVHTVEFNLTKEGFQIKKEKIDPIVNRLLEAIKHPLTCGFVIKLTFSKEGFYHYDIDFI